MERSWVKFEIILGILYKNIEKVILILFCCVIDCKSLIHFHNAEL